MQEARPTRRNRNRDVAEMESGRDASKDAKHAGDGAATQDRSIESADAQGEESGSSKKRRRQNKTTDRYQGETSASCFPTPHDN